MNLHIEQKILDTFNSNDIKIYFYESWCEWTKINFWADFDKTGLEFITVSGKDIYFEQKDKENLDGWKIVSKIDTNWWHSTHEKYIFLSEKIKSRCGCATSFSFEKKLIDKNKLNKLKIAFKK